EQDVDSKKAPAPGATALGAAGLVFGWCGGWHGTPGVRSGAGGATMQVASQLARPLGSQRLCRQRATLILCGHFGDRPLVQRNGEVSTSGQSVNGRAL